MCLFSFVFLWVIYDMFDNLSDFVESKAPIYLVSQFYIEQIPRAVSLGLPVALLLGTLYTLLNLSKTNEFVAMQACGISLMEISAPVLAIGLFSMGVLAWLNWEWNPKSIRNREAIINQIQAMKAATETRRSDDDERRRQQLDSLVYRSRDSKRIWFIGLADIEIAKLWNVEVLQMDETGRDVWKYYAGSMTWDGRHWRMTNAMRVFFDIQGNAVAKEYYEIHREPALRETFLQVTGNIWHPEVMSIPELARHAKENADFNFKRLAPFQTYYYYRLSNGLSCMVAVLISLPFALTHARRSLFAGFSKIILLYFAFLTLLNLFPALGAGARLHPAVAGAGPVVLFTLIGAVSLAWKASGRGVPTSKDWEKFWKKIGSAQHPPRQVKRVSKQAVSE